MCYFLPFYPTNYLKNQNFEKMKKMPEDIIILHLCKANVNHMLYGSWNVKHNRNNFFVNLGHFFTLLQPKNQNFKKLKKMPWDIIILHKCTKNHNHILYCSWKVARDGCNFYFSFWAIFCPSSSPPPQQPKKLNLL